MRISPFLLLGLASCAKGADWRDAIDVVPVAEPSRVIVVGAGMSGLAAAQALHLDGREVVVLEARDRLGGRTHTADVDGVPVDLGGAWIHGDRDNPAALLMKGYGLEYEPDRSQTTPVVVKHDGETYGGGKLLASSTFSNKVMRRARVAAEDLGLEDVSIRQTAEWWADDMGLDGWKRDLRLFVTEILFTELDFAAPSDDISAQSSFQAHAFSGGDHVPVGGYKVLVDKLAEGIDVRLSEPVTAIDYTSETVVVTTGAGTYEASHVIVTVPLWVLQSDQIDFTPPLPPEKRNSLELLGTGNLEKVILRYDERWWAGDGRTFVFWDEQYGRYPLCVDFTDHAGAPTLACLSGGAFSRNVRSGESDEAVVAGTLENLAAALQRESVPQPTATAITRWTSGSRNNGSYSYIRVGGDVGDLDVLAQPLDDRLLFAGEHTAGPFHATVHGALITGLREAARLGADPYALPGLQ